MSGRVAILLTATVNPGVYAPQSARRSLDDRFKDYVSAINFYASLTSDKIAGVILCENSNFDFSELARKIDSHIVQSEIEIITFDGNEKTDDVHYGYSELGIIDYAFSQSKLLRKCDAFLKISGRLIVKNITDLLTIIPSKADFAVDFRHAYPREGGPRYRARTQIMYSRMEFYETYLFKKREQMRGVCTHIEEFIPILLSPLESRLNVLVRFPLEVEIAGVSGSNNKNYQSISYQMKRTIRGVIRKTLPRLWL